MKTNSKAAWNPLLLVLIIACSMLFFACSWTGKTDIAEDDKAERDRRDEEVKAASAFVLKYCTTTSQEHGGHTEYAKRTFQEIVINIPGRGYGDESQFVATAEIDYNEDSGSKHFVGHNKVTITGTYFWNEGVIRGTFEFTEVGYWTRPEVDADYKCEYNSRYKGECTSMLFDPSNMPIYKSGTIARLTSTGTTTLDTLSTWANGERSNDNHHESEYAYALDLIVAE